MQALLWRDILKEYVFAAAVGVVAVSVPIWGFIIARTEAKLFSYENNVTYTLWELVSKGGEFLLFLLQSVFSPAYVFITFSPVLCLVLCVFLYRYARQNIASPLSNNTLQKLRAVFPFLCIIVACIVHQAQREWLSFNQDVILSYIPLEKLSGITQYLATEDTDTAAGRLGRIDTWLYVMYIPLAFSILTVFMTATYYPKHSIMIFLSLYSFIQQFVFLPMSYEYYFSKHLYPLTDVVYDCDDADCSGILKGVIRLAETKRSVMYLDRKTPDTDKRYTVHSISTKAVQYETSSQNVSPFKLCQIGLSADNVPCEALDAYKAGELSKEEMETRFGLAQTDAHKTHNNNVSETVPFILAQAATTPVVFSAQFMTQKSRSYVSVKFEQGSLDESVSNLTVKGHDHTYDVPLKPDHYDSDYANITVNREDFRSSCKEGCDIYFTDADSIMPESFSTYRLEAEQVDSVYLSGE